MRPSGACAAAPERSAQKLFIPTKRVDTISEASLAALRAEFGAPDPPLLAPRSPSPHPAAAERAWETCPFCQEPLPVPMSRALHALLQRWMQKSRAGAALRPTDTVAVCQRHRDEYDVIPNGRRRGWPLALDFHELRRRVTDPKRRYMRTLQDRLLAPHESRFFLEARRVRETVGKKASSSAHQIERFDERQCGYYGEQGRELFADILHAAFVHDPLMASLDLKQAAVRERIQPLDAAQFVDEALLPELVCMLIQDDLGGEEAVSYDDARQIQRESRKFGVAMYPSDTSDARHTRRTSGSWVGASPRRKRRTSAGDGYVQQTLPNLRRSSRIPEAGPRTMLDPSDSEPDAERDSEPERSPKAASGVRTAAAHPAMHQQRLHVVRSSAGAPRPAPRSSARK